MCIENIADAQLYIVVAQGNASFEWAAHFIGARY